MPAADGGWGMPATDPKKGGGKSDKGNKGKGGGGGGAGGGGNGGGANKGGGAGANGGGLPGPAAPNTTPTLTEARQVFNAVTKKRDSQGKPPCLHMQIWSACSNPGCTFSHEKKEGGNGLSIVLTNHEKKCCRIVLEEQAKKKGGHGMPGTDKGKGKPDGGKAKGDPKGRPKGEQKGDPKGKGKGKREKGKPGQGKGPGDVVCTNCGQTGHYALACPNPPRPKGEPKGKAPAAPTGANGQPC